MNLWRFLSRYHPRSVRSHVYMLQASEYNVRDYLRWLKRVSSFVNVEERKQLSFTKKALLLLGTGWAIVVAVAIAVVFGFVLLPWPWDILLAALLVLLAPYMLSYGLAVAVWKLRILQIPVVSILTSVARRTLARHKGVKIAIAGSYGKTSTREILRTVLSESKKVAAPPESYNTPLGIASFVRGLKGDEDVLIFELGEYYPGDIRALARIVQPDWGIITGVNEAHLEKFGTLEKTTDTIFELAEFVDPARLYINGENELARVRSKSGNVVYQRTGAGKWGVDNAKTDLSGTTFTLSHESKTFQTTSGLLGLHMLAPLALAADVASRLGLSDEQIVAGIAKTKPFAHRLEPKSWGDGVTFLDDSYNGNPDGARAAIVFLASLEGRPIYVTPGLVEGGARVREIHEEVGRQLAEAGIERVALIRTSVTPHIESGLKKAAFKGEIQWHDDMPACLAALRAQALSGDIILVQNDWPDQYV